MSNAFTRAFFKVPGFRRIFGSAPVPLLSTAITAYPVLMPIREIYRKLLTVDNKYQLYDMFCDLDPELEGAINKLALVARYAYKGIGVHIGHELDEQERALLEEVQRLEDIFDFQGLFLSIAKHLVKYGDDIYVIKIEDNAGLTSMRALPIQFVTILQNRKQKQDISAQVFEPNIYMLNEFDEAPPAGTQQTWPKWPKKNRRREGAIHFGLNNKAESIYDTRGRYTFGVWSKSPIECLRVKLMWKVSLQINDILLRQKLVPRYHHKVDLSAFDPNLFAGDTIEDRIAAAKKAATTELESYKKTLVDPLKEVDKDYISGKEIEITSIEPRRVTYVDPNPLIDQINKSIFAATGIQESAVMGRGLGTFATELVVTSFTALAGEILADVIKRQLLRIVRSSIRAKYRSKFSDEDLSKIDIRIGLALGVERGEAMRRAAILDAMGIATFDELRNEVGLYNTLDEATKKAMIEVKRQANTRGRPIADRTIQDIISKYITRIETTREPETPESKSDQQMT